MTVAAAEPGLRFEDVEVDTELPTLRIPLTTTFVVTSAIASRDFQEVHHDRDAAQRQGAQDVFLNILTTNGLVARLVTDWAGPGAVLRKTSIRLGVPAFAGDELVLTGSVTATQPGERFGLVTVRVRGTDRLGDHVTGTVEVALPRRGAT